VKFAFILYSFYCLLRATRVQAGDWYTTAAIAHLQGASSLVNTLQGTTANSYLVQADKTCFRSAWESFTRIYLLNCGSVGLAD